MRSHSGQRITNSKSCSVFPPPADCSVSGNLSKAGGDVYITSSHVVSWKETIKIQNFGWWNLRNLRKHMGKLICTGMEIDLTDRRKSWNRLETSCKAGCCGGAAPSLRDLEILIKLHKSSTSIRILELTLWLWLTLCHGFSMALYAHRNRWFTVLNSMGGCSMASPVSHNFITRW